MATFIKRKAVTLIEMIVLLVIFSVAIVSLLRLFVDINMNTVKTERLNQTNLLASSLMEEVLSKHYDEQDQAPFSSNLGPDSGETAGSFDDIDDYNGYTDSSLPGYTAQVSVSYVYLDNSNNWQNCSVTSCGAISDCSTCQECCFKKITVTAHDNQHLAPEVSLETIKTGNQ